MKNILDLSLEELKAFMIENKESAFRAKQVFDWIYKGVGVIDEIRGIPLSTKEKLKKDFFIGVPEIIKKLSSKDKKTIKYLFKLHDDNIIEAVLMKYDYGNSVCLSTQVGCNMGCSFCASTLFGKARDLSSGDILGQILKMQFDTEDRISNIVLMGSGEPFDNYDNVIKFLYLVTDKDGLNIGSRHITVSTCGIIEKIREFADLNNQVNLAISLHAPFDETRKSMMKIARKYSIEELMDSCKYYVKKTNRRITFEYALVDGVNDRDEDAKALGRLLSSMLCHVNLIPINDVKERNYIRSRDDAIKNFKKILETYGVVATIRKEMGADIDAACGQLRRDYIKKNEV